MNKAERIYKELLHEKVGVWYVSDIYGAKIMIKAPSSILKALIKGCKFELVFGIDDERLEKIAEALGVSADGLRKFSTDNVLYYTNNYYENCGANTTNVGASNVENVHNFSVKQAMTLFEELLKMEREKFQTVTGEK